MKPLRIGVVATSSVVPKIELELGVRKLEQQGFQVLVHPTVLQSDWLYVANDQARAEAFLEFAFDKTLDVLWCPRGGYGATHLLPLIQKATARKKPSKKLLIGYSDVTALLEFTRVRWGWKTLHGPMIAAKTFSDLKLDEWSTLLNCLNRFSRLKGKTPKPLYRYSLKPLFLPKNFKKIVAPVVGGNFSVWNAMIGTPYAGKAQGKILFLEDLQENLGRVNRMIHHLEQSGGLRGVKAIVLGDFLDCKDSVPHVFKSVPKDLRNPRPEELMLLRTPKDATEGLHLIFCSLGERTGIPIFTGAPVGHADNQFSVIFGEKHQLTAAGELLIKG